MTTTTQVRNAQALTAQQVWALGPDELLDLLEAGHPIERSAIEDRTYRGVSLGLPGVIEKLTWKTFQKVFVNDTDGLRGWNVRLEQDGVDAASRPKIRAGEPQTFGHFQVRATTQDDRTRYRGRSIFLPRALMLDYGLGGNGLDPMSMLRDPIVSLDGDNARLLLGWSYLQVGPANVPTPSFFTLEDEGPRTHFVPRP